MATHVNMIKAPHTTGDKFVDLLQGPVVQVTVGIKTSTFDPPIYILPRALLVSQSGYFRDRIAGLDKSAAELTSSGKISKDVTPNLTSAATPNPTNPPPASAPVAGNLSQCFKITLHGADHGAFGNFLRYIYQGSAPFDFNPPNPHRNPAGPQAPQIPPSILAWNLGAFLRAPDFQNHALKYTHAVLGRSFSLTPHLVTWIYTNTNHNDALARLVLDTLVTYWAPPTDHVAKGAELVEAWYKVFATFPDLNRAWMFGLQGKQAQQVHMAHRYMVPTPTRAPGPLVSPYATPVPPPTLAAKAKQQQQQQHQGGYASDLKKKEVPKQAIKQEDRAIVFLKSPSAPTSKKRSASPTTAQNRPKLPKLAEKPVVDLTEDKNQEKEIK